MVGRVAMFARAAMSMASRAAIPGTVVELLARATAVLKTVGGVSARTSLSGKSALSVKAAAQPPLFAAFLAGVARVAANARSGASASANIMTSAGTRIAVSQQQVLGRRQPGRQRQGCDGGKARSAIPAASRPRGNADVSPRPLVRSGARHSANGQYARPGRLGRLNASLLKAFGEEFDIAPMTPSVDVNSRSQADISRTAKLDISGI